MHLKHRINIACALALITGLALLVGLWLYVKPYFAWVEGSFTSTGAIFFWELVLPSLVISAIVCIPLIMYIVRLRRLYPQES